MESTTFRTTVGCPHHSDDCRDAMKNWIGNKERRLVTIAAPIAHCRTDQPGPHVRKAPDNGLSQDEVAHAITHLAFYTDWPGAMNTITRLKHIIDARAALPRPHHA
ncbi:carboxymuconolactone decarboxylase family protein [Streptomyces sp. NPDC056983]|uniref:carboxymuconolactone decarboxylase family protein n=1 Tax=Streptomyces sp. NPDC056983 TaxID=3345987 RepID=UPI0036356C9B